MLEMKSQMASEYPEMIELGKKSIIGTWHLDLESEIEIDIDVWLESIYGNLERSSNDLESITDMLISHNPKFNVSKLADIFMKISDLKATSILLRDTFGPKS